MTQTEIGIGVSDSRSEHLSQATDWFMRLRSEGADAGDLAQFQRWLEENADNASAYREVSASWSAIGEHASAPEIMAGRRDALEDARRGARGRWRAKSLFFLLRRVRAKQSAVRFAWTASAVVLAFALLTALWLQMRAQVYSTGIGERRTLTMTDGSVVTLDARTRIHVKYRDKERLIALEQGQARFDVAKDPSRPFRVKASNETVVALGTQFNVEIVNQNVLVTMIEGHVAVVPDTSPRAASQIELTAGEALHVRQDGEAIRLPKVNVERVTAWQSGKIFFDNEPLAGAAERVNRYARERIQVDPSAAQVSISGVFNAGDANAFIEAVTAYFPVKAVRSNGSTLLLFAGDTRKGQPFSGNP
jgi:transmembrane sensor